MRWSCARLPFLLTVTERLSHRIYNVSTARPPDSYLDTTRLRADTGFRPEYDVERAVPDYVDWLRGHDR